MNREEQIKMWESAAGKMEKKGKFGTGDPKRPVPGAASKHGAGEGVRDSAIVHGSSPEAAAKRKELGFGK